MTNSNRFINIGLLAIIKIAGISTVIGIVPKLTEFASNSPQKLSGSTPKQLSVILEKISSQRWFKPTIQRHFVETGHSLVELITVVAIIGIIGLMVAPDIDTWKPNSRLTRAARDLFSNLQKARMGAVKDNLNVSLRFNATNAPGYYYFDTDPTGTDGAYDANEERINLADYESGIDFGTGSAVNSWSGGALVQQNVLTFTGRGSASSGSIYLSNENNDTCYGLTVVSSGSIKLRKYNGSAWE